MKLSEIIDRIETELLNLDVSVLDKLNLQLDQSTPKPETVDDYTDMVGRLVDLFVDIEHLCESYHYVLGGIEDLRNLYEEEL